MMRSYPDTSIASDMILKSSSLGEDTRLLRRFESVPVAWLRAGDMLLSDFEPQPRACKHLGYDEDHRVHSGQA